MRWTMLFLFLATAALHAQQPSQPVRVDTVLIRVDSTRDAVFLESVVTQRPSFISAQPMQYPDGMRQAGVQGRVVIQAIIDTLGRAEFGSIKIVSTPNPEFNDAAREWILSALFRPARVHGQAVRVLVNLPIDFKIRRSLTPHLPPS